MKQPGVDALIFVDETTWRGCTLHHRNFPTHGNSPHCGACAGTPAGRSCGGETGSRSCGSEARHNWGHFALFGFSALSISSIIEAMWVVVAADGAPRQSIL